MFSKSLKFSVVLLLTLILLTASCSNEDPLNQSHPRYFVVQVGSERFIMKITDPVTIALAIDNFQGNNHRFPSGRIAPGNGGFNQPYNWHYIPETVQMVEASIELCDGLPSYVNAHVNDFVASGYCPWSGKVVQIGR